MVTVGEIGTNALVVKSTTQLDRQGTYITELVRALVGCSDLRHLVLHVREGDNSWRATAMFITVLKDAGDP